MTPHHPFPIASTPTPLSPFEAREEWRWSALALALVVAPEALQVVRAELGHDAEPAAPRDLPPRLDRRVGRRPGVRPPRSC